MVIIVKTSVDPKANTFAIEVTDNGPGIPAADKARIFEPYFTTKSQGTGLGLAIVNSIVTEHQGEVRVFDSSPRGTRFVIKLPVTPRGGVQRRLGVGPKVP
jgi:two-component system nitrogen regulation sensor histidine kinase NtrY